MNQLQKNLQDILQEHPDLRHILVDKDLAKFGDALINFLYSMAKTVITGKFCGEKVSDRSLAAAIRETKLKQETRSRSSVDDLGDAVEAFCAYLWVMQIVSIEEIVNTLSDAIRDLPFGHHKIDKAAEQHAFKALIQFLYTKMNNQSL